MHLAKRHSNRHRQRSDEFRFPTTLDLADLDRRCALTGVRSARGVHREHPELVVSLLDQVHHRVFQINDIVVVAFGPNGAADLSLLDDVAGDATAAIGSGCLPLEIDVVLADLDDLRVSRRVWYVEFASQFERRRSGARLAQTSSVLGSYAELVLVATHQVVADVGLILHQIVIGRAPAVVIPRIADFDLVTLNGGATVVSGPVPEDGHAGGVVVGDPWFFRRVWYRERELGRYGLIGCQWIGHAVLVFSSYAEVVLAIGFQAKNVVVGVAGEAADLCPELRDKAVRINILSIPYFCMN